MYVRRFYERALSYYDPVVEEVLGDVCFHDMMEE